jgi:hypothetical protein
MKKGVGSGVGSGSGSISQRYGSGSASGSISQRYGSGSAPKCHGSPSLLLNEVFLAVLWICDILVRIWIWCPRIRSTDYGSGSESCSFRQWPSIYQQQQKFLIFGLIL